MDDIETDVSHRGWAQKSQCLSTPSRRNIMEVLYPPSYLNNHLIPANPPGYLLEDPLSTPSFGSSASRRSLVACSTWELSPSLDDADPIPQARELCVEQQPDMDLDTEGVDNSDPPPAYLRFDAGSQLAAPDILGPYPHISLLRRLVLSEQGFSIERQ
ncbi:hypothetical protein V8B97DRAFT_744492 [Scleroderma yunnanense]